MRRTAITIAALAALATPVVLYAGNVTMAKKKKSGDPIETAVACVAPALYHGAYQSLTAKELADYCIEVATEVHAAFP